jgi:hypothetical protein
MTNTKKILIAIYLIGVICVGVLLARMFIGGNNITNPEAMLPITYQALKGLAGECIRKGVDDYK